MDGPQLDGSVFERTYEFEKKLWIVGEHTAEGPASDPFILVPEDNPSRWSLHFIYLGASELTTVTRRAHGDFVALVRHLELHDDGWTGPVYVHRSFDGGRTWKKVGRAKEGLQPGGQPFKEIQNENGNWRILDPGNEESEIQRRVKALAQWKTVSKRTGKACKP
jgi:hypothetical protein